jgi:hypothetical protein
MWWLLTRRMKQCLQVSKLVDAIITFKTIVKIHKYKGLHERHHFILMAMEVHGALGHHMDHFIKECAHFFMINN